ncbi:NfeD family protein [Blautia sp. NSJ-175]|uniref:NfeD family protein n=1 Tax=Blautia sp. NSJ-175 TaxID=2931396 RepID=UPI001FCFF30E|nr:NfeD family protein [Blautia sp. NSJ-175]MCJ7846555.1 NfeD family protein [Blautia sp. NSJ-175]
MLTFFTAFTAGSIAVMWLILLGVLLVVEIITLGLTTIWFAGGALAAFLAALAGGPLWLQIILFFAISILLLIFTRPIAIKYMNKNVSKTNVDSLPGEKAVVIKTIDNLRGTGQAVVNGLEWSAKSKDETIIDEGKVVRIVAVEGVKLIVEEEK